MGLTWLQWRSAAVRPNSGDADDYALHRLTLARHRCRPCTGFDAALFEDLLPLLTQRRSNPLCSTTRRPAL
eukprot:scaffold212358_cov31-Prasinocladus_malaysianus.AAC.1